MFEKEKLNHTFKNIKGKKIAFCGIGTTNLPIIKMFHNLGCTVTALDRRTKDKIGKISDELENNGIKLKLGEDYLDNLENFDIIFRTPGMKYNLPELEKVREEGIVVTSEMEMFFELCPCKIISVTGSDGKTTTTTIISEILKHAGYKVHLGGNIGTPLLPLISEIGCDDIAVVELSSFQLISMRQSPDIAVITNLSPNHLDIHKDMNEYISAKKNIILHQNAFSKSILNLDNEITKEFKSIVRGQPLFFSRATKVKNGAYLSEDSKIYMADNGQDKFIINSNEIKIPGNHNIENYLAAISAVWKLVKVDDIIYTAKNFSGVEHRTEFVKSINGVSYYNDSIASSPTRTISGTLSLYKEKIILIAGGYDKNIPFDNLGRAITEKVKILILMGNTSNKIEDAVKNSSNYKSGEPNIIRVNSMEEAVNTASKTAKNGDIVALSPACASFDMYPNFAARGKHFKQLVNCIK